MKLLQEDPVPGSNYTYGYDNMGRLNTMTDQLNSIGMGGPGHDRLTRTDHV